MVRDCAHMVGAWLLLKWSTLNTYIDMHIIQIKDNIYSIESEIRLKPREIVIVCALHEK